MSAAILPEGYQERKELPLWDFQHAYFPDAWLEVVKVAVEGNKQHNPGQPLHWAREKSKDQLNCAARHQFDYGQGQMYDTDNVHHLAKAVWRLMAQIQLDKELEQKRLPRQVKLSATNQLGYIAPTPRHKARRA